MTIEEALKSQRQRYAASYRPSLYTFAAWVAECMLA